MQIATKGKSPSSHMITSPHVLLYLEKIISRQLPMEDDLLDNLCVNSLTPQGLLDGDMENKGRIESGEIGLVCRIS